VVSLSAAAPTTSLLVGELLQGGDYAGVKTTLVDRIGWRCRRLCRGAASRRAAGTTTGFGRLTQGQGLPQHPNVMQGNDEPSRPDPKAIARANQVTIRTHITKLYEMVSELKEQVDKTDATTTLSISIVKKAQQIEKLAKQIKDLAKG